MPAWLPAHTHPDGRGDELTSLAKAFTPLYIVRVAVKACRAIGRRSTLLTTYALHDLQHIRLDFTN